MYYFFVDFEDAKKDIHQRCVLVDVPIGVPLQQVFNDFYDATRDRISDRSGAVILLRPAAKSQLPSAGIDAICDNRHVDTRGWRQWLRLLKDARNSSNITFARFANHSIHIVGSENFTHFISVNINPGAEDAIAFLGIDPAALLRCLQDAEIDHLIAEGRCRLPVFENQYYRVPSGRLVRSFIRVGNIQRSLTRAGCHILLAFAVPDRLHIGVITDTWSISSLSQNISRRLVEYRRRPSKPCPIEMLGDYADIAQQVRIAEIIGGFVNRLSLPDHSGSVLILLSATHTGSIQKGLNAYLMARGIADRVRYVSILKLGAEAPVIALRDLSKEPAFAPVLNPSKRG